MKNGDKVQIKDGSYMITVGNGGMTHEGISGHGVIGWCKDIFTIVVTGGLFPSDNSHVKHPERFNDTMIMNDSNGEIWFCHEDVNLKIAEGIPQKKKLPKTKEDLVGFLYEWDIKEKYIIRAGCHGYNEFLKDYED
jgi:hypothetical protein